jgi:hypothetical protein
MEMETQKLFNKTKVKNLIKPSKPKKYIKVLKIFKLASVEEKKTI